ncbi:transcriptional repressor CTCF, partial [Biomphalaria glabrata]
PTINISFNVKVKGYLAFILSFNMDPEDETGSSGQGQSLHDLQNYLSTFKKEIEPGDDILSHIDVDTGDVHDLYSSTGESSVVSQFTSGFYSEQGILDTHLNDDPSQQIQGIVSTAETDMSSAMKDKVATLDLSSVQTQMVSYGDSSLDHGIADIQTNAMSGSLIMTSLGDSLDPTGSKVIRIVSLDEDGQYLTLGDTSQILHQDLDMVTDTLTSTDGVLTLHGSSSTFVSAGSTHTTPILTSALGSVADSGDVMATDAKSSNENQIIQLQTSSDSQPRIITLPQGTQISAEALQMSVLLSSDGTLNPDLGFQTITIMPPELSQGGEMNYVIMAPQDGSKESNQQMAEILDIMKENPDYSEGLLEINGEVKHVLRVVPKKFLTANFDMQLVCDYCDYTSPKRYLLARHMKTHSDERPHKCKECERGFKTPASLMNHVNTHTGIRPHKCKDCGAAFTTSGELVRHIRYRHTFEKPHRCPNCDYASVELSKLKRHMRSHTGERPYKCPHCPYASPDTYKLKRHLRIHTGEKPYECDVCHTRFTQSNSLKAHKLIHSGNKPVFQCKLCPTTCGRKTDLKIHFNKLHSEGSPLECKKCGQMFSDRYSYKQHVRSHDIEKCFKCDDCDFIANTERSFDAHAAIHSNGKKYECDSCHVSFNLKQSLDKHKIACQIEENLNASRDKESAEQTMYNTSSNGHTHQSKHDILLSNESSSNSSHLISGPLASGTLHRNLLQDIKDGKLGDVPQVVIVHPDGTLEEISSKLPIGDKLNIDDLFSALSNNDKSQELETNCSDVNSEKESADDDDSHDQILQRSPVKHTNLKKKDAADHGNDDDVTGGESSQCEASTQAELESETETDFVQEKQLENKTSLDEEFLTESHTDSLLDQSEIAEHITEHMSDNTSETLTSIMQGITPSSMPPTLLTTEADQPGTSSGPQYVVVKGYTCLSSETGQPTLVNVAVDKDSLLKMLASFGGSGVQLIAGDMDTLNISLDSKSCMISVAPEQLSDFAGLASVSAITDGSTLGPADGDSTCLEEESKANSTLETAMNKETVNKQNKFATLSIDALSMGRSPHNVDTSPPKELLSPSFASNPKVSPPLPSSAHLIAFKTNILSSDQVETPQDTAGHSKVDMTRDTLSPIEHFCDSSDVGMEIFPEVPETSQQIHTEPDTSSKTQESQNKSVTMDIQSNNSEACDHIKLEYSPVEQIAEKHKKYSRKRVSGADPSLVRTGKRVRKALVRVSM